MSKNEYSCILISDFNIDNFAAYLNNDKDPPILKSIVAPFGQVAQVLVDKNLKYWKEKVDFAIVWTRPEAVIRSFNQVINYESISLDNIYEDVDEYASLLLGICDRVKFIFVPTWVLQSYY